MWKNHPALGSATGALVIALVTLLARAEPTTTPIPLAPHGDSLGHSGGTPIELSPTAFIAATAGADGDVGTDDDTMLLVRHLNTKPSITTIATPFLTKRARPARLSASRALMPGAGPDGTWLTADDVVYLLSQVGSEAPSTPITVGGLADGGGSSPQALSALHAVVVTAGPDNVQNTADDEIVLLSDLGDGNHVTRLSAPYMQDGGAQRPVVLTPSRILVTSGGADATWETADDVTYMFDDLGGTNERTDLATPYLFVRAAPSRPARASGSSAALASVGADGERQTADDRVYLLESLDTGGAVVHVDVGPVLSFGAGRPTPLNEALTVVASAGPDEEEQTLDDELVVLAERPDGLEISHVRVGYLGYDMQSHPKRLSSSSCAVATAGPDGEFRTADDEVVVLHGAGGMNAISRIPVSALGWQTAFQVVPLGKTSFAIANGGPDGQLSTDDDAIAFVSNVDAGFALQSVPIGGPIDSREHYAQVLQRLGSQRAVMVAPGADGRIGQGGDDEFIVFEDIPEGFGFQVRTVVARFKPGAPEKPARFKAKLQLTHDEPERFGAGPVTFSIGGAAQTIPGSAFELKKNGAYLYRDKKGENGFLRKVQWRPRTGAMTIVGKGVGTGLERTDAESCPLCLTTPEWSCGETLPGTARRNGFKYKAPKQ